MCVYNYIRRTSLDVFTPLCFFAALFPLISIKSRVHWLRFSSRHFSCEKLHQPLRELTTRPRLPTDFKSPALQLLMMVYCCIIFVHVYSSIICRSRKFQLVAFMKIDDARVCSQRCTFKRRQTRLLVLVEVKTILLWSTLAFCRSSELTYIDLKIDLRQYSIWHCLSCILYVNIYKFEISKNSLQFQLHKPRIHKVSLWINFSRVSAAMKLAHPYIRQISSANILWTAVGRTRLSACIWSPWSEQTKIKPQQTALSRIIIYIYA